MIGIYIFVFILILLIFYFIYINTNTNMNKDMNNSTNTYMNTNISLHNDIMSEYDPDRINMNSVDSIGNIYNDYYNNIDYTNKINPYDNNYKPIEINKLRKCQVPTLNTEQCYKSRYYECPIVNGSYLQCTNNYVPKPTEYNADCGNRTFDMVPYPWKISENCYYDKINFDRNKEFNKISYN